MKKNIISILYIGLASGQFYEAGIAIQKLPERLPFPKGELQVYAALLPEYCGKTFFRHKPKSWKSEAALRVILEAHERLANEIEEPESKTIKTIKTIKTKMVLSPQVQQIVEQFSQVPTELLAARLYASRPFLKICVSMSFVAEETCLEQAIALLKPYLAGLQQVIWVGKPSWLSDKLEEYLYQEYGMLMVMANRPPKNVLWLDMREDEEIQSDLRRTFYNNKHIHVVETLKFLDTTAKNGYNTGVN